MATGRGTKLTGAVGEFLVSAELCRRGLIATPFSGNVPHYDIIVSNENGGHLVIQVKAINKESWQFDIRKFVEITMAGDRQVIGEPVKEPYPHLVCIFVALGDSNKTDRFFVFEWRQLRSIIICHHRDYLSKHGGVRPRAPKSTHCSIKISQLEQFEDNWETVFNFINKKIKHNKCVQYHLILYSNILQIKPNTPAQTSPNKQ